MTSSLVRLTYLGQLMSKTYTGQVTDQRYRFGKDRPHGYVYQEDLQQFLEFRENGFDVFKRFQEPVIAQVTEPEPEPEPSPEPSLESDGPTADLDISQMTVAEIKDTRTTRSEWQLMLDEERNGKGRSSVVTFIEKKLES